MFLSVVALMFTPFIIGQEIGKKAFQIQWWEVIIVCDLFPEMSSASASPPGDFD